jgi:hypothetical protein
MATPISPSEQTTTFKSRRVRQKVSLGKPPASLADCLLALLTSTYTVGARECTFDPLHTATRDRRRSPSEGERDELPDVVRSENTLQGLSRETSGVAGGLLARTAHQHVYSWRTGMYDHTCLLTALLLQQDL